MANPTPNTAGLLRGHSKGRPAGTPNKASLKVKAILDQVFSEAFPREEFKKTLVEQIVGLSIDPRLLALMLNYYAGKPAMAVDHRVEGSLSLARLIAGQTVETEDTQEPED